MAAFHVIALGYVQQAHGHGPRPSPCAPMPRAGSLPRVLTAFSGGYLNSYIITTPVGNCSASPRRPLGCLKKRRISRRAVHFGPLDCPTSVGRSRAETGPPDGAQSGSLVFCPLALFATLCQGPLTQVLKHPIHRQAYTLVHQFRTILMHQQEVALPAWLHASETSGIPELVSFAADIRDDYDAVLAGIHGPWSQGMVEGFNNKIKRLKRMMYGRGGFDLLRKRTLHKNVA